MATCEGNENHAILLRARRLLGRHPCVGGINRQTLRGDLDRPARRRAAQAGIHVDRSEIESARADRPSFHRAPRRSRDHPDPAARSVPPDPSARTAGAASSGNARAKISVNFPQPAPRRVIAPTRGYSLSSALPECKPPRRGTAGSAGRCRRSSGRQRFLPAKRPTSRSATLGRRAKFPMLRLRPVTRDFRQRPQAAASPARHGGTRSERRSIQREA